MEIKELLFRIKFDRKIYIFVLYGLSLLYWYEYFLTAGNTASAKGASLWGFLGAIAPPENFQM